MYHKVYFVEAWVIGSNEFDLPDLSAFGTSVRDASSSGTGGQTAPVIGAVGLGLFEAKAMPTEHLAAFRTPSLSRMVYCGESWTLDEDGQRVPADNPESPGLGVMPGHDTPWSLADVTAVEGWLNAAFGAGNVPQSWADALAWIRAEIETGRDVTRAAFMENMRALMRGEPFAAPGS